MNSAAFEVLAKKFGTLPERDQKTVFDFVEFLSQKRNSRKKKIDKKKILLGMSFWSDEDLKIFEDVRTDMNKWRPEAF
jgi:uncharacterized protein YfbU (UPF0304 family)